MKGGTLAKRSANRAKAEEELAAAKENDDAELVSYLIIWCYNFFSLL